MDSTRIDLQQKVRRAYTEYRAGQDPGAFCPICGANLTTSHLHEWLVKRGTLPLAKQPLIMTVENCILVCPEHHIVEGQTKGFAAKCLVHATRHLGAARVGVWYTDLLDKLPSLPPGILPTRKAPTTLALRFLEMAAQVYSVTLPPSWRMNAATGQAILAWRGKKADGLELGDISQTRIIGLLEEGRWLYYLAGILDNPRLTC